MHKQLEFLNAVYVNVTRRKIDLVIKSPEKKDRGIYHTAKSEGLMLY